MDKLKLAHEMALAIQCTKLLYDMELVSEMAWKYADAMQAEADKRVNKERPDVLKEEWQPDWSQAPNDAIGWMIFDGASTWLGESGFLIEEAPSFGFTGSHLVERPHVF